MRPNAIGTIKNRFFPLLGSQCPVTHPYAYYNGEYCCATNREKSNSTIGDKCDGSIILNDSLCCEDDKYVPCPNGTCIFTGGHHLTLILVKQNNVYTYITYIIQFIFRYHII